MLDRLWALREEVKAVLEALAAIEAAKQPAGDGYRESQPF